MKNLTRNQQIALGIGGVILVMVIVLVGLALTSNSKKDDNNDDDTNQDNDSNDMDNDDDNIGNTPADNFKNARNSQRGSDILQILNAMTQYTSESGNSLKDFGTIPDCSAGLSADIGTSSDSIDLEKVLVDEWIVGIPKDPNGGTNEKTGYKICKNVGGRVTVMAPMAEDGEVVEVKR